MTNAHRTASLVSAILIALFAGFFFISAHSSTSPEAITNPQQPAHETYAPPDDHALADMYTYATLHLGTFRELPETFNGTTNWSHAWSLHWLDVDHDGAIIRVYHLTDKDNPGRRFVATWDTQSGRATEWEAVK